MPGPVRAEWAEIAGMGFSLGVIGVDLRNASSYVNTHAGPSERAMGEIIAD